MTSEKSSAIVRILSAMIARMVAAALARWGFHMSGDEMIATYIVIESFVHSVGVMLHTAFGKLMVERVKNSLTPPPRRKAKSRPSLTDLAEEIEKERKRR